MKKQRPEVNPIKTIRIVSAMLFLALFVFSLTQLAAVMAEYRDAWLEYEELAAIARPVPQGASGGQSQAAPDTGIDFAALSEINSEIVGWITLPGTVLDYPVMQAEDNDKYLKTTFLGESNPSGSIFLDYNTPADYSQPNSIIYGHNMSDGSMFSILNEYKSQEFYDKNPVILLYTKTEAYKGYVFSAYVTDIRGTVFTSSFSHPGSYAAFLKQIASLSAIKTEASAKEKDNIVTLSTCTGLHKDARMVVHLKLVPA